MYGLKIWNEVEMGNCKIYAICMQVASLLSLYAANELFSIYYVLGGQSSTMNKTDMVLIFHGA